MCEHRGNEPGDPAPIWHAHGPHCVHGGQGGTVETIYIGSGEVFFSSTYLDIEISIMCQGLK